MGIIKKIVDAFKKTKESFSRKLDSLLSNGEICDDLFDELEDLLISCDIGVSSSIEITENLRVAARKNKLRNKEDVKNQLKTEITEILGSEKNVYKTPCIITVIGVNGVGKTTTIGKLAAKFSREKKSVMLIAGDTFRAGASAQLNEWAKRSKSKIVMNGEGADSSSVVFDGLTSARAKKTDVVIVDTAGRLHNKVNLMEELKKISRTMEKVSPEIEKHTFIVIDATTGQNAWQQINAFNETFPIDGVILTKVDGTAKGGVVIGIKKETNIPIVFLGTGEQIDDLEEFNAESFVSGLFD